MRFIKNINKIRPFVNSCNLLENDIYYSLNNIDFKCMSLIEALCALLSLFHWNLSKCRKISLGHFVARFGHVSIILNHSSLVNLFTLSDFPKFR